MVRPLVLALLIILAAIAPMLVPTGVPAQGGGSVIVYTGLEFVPLGGASAAPDTGGGGGVCHDCLVISNIGSSGDDGVEVQPGNAQGAWLEFFDLPEPPPTQTAVVIITGLSTLGSSLHQTIAEIAFKDTASARTMETDWAFLGSLARRVEVWSGGNPVAQFGGVTGPIGISEMPLQAGMAVDGMIYPLPDPVLPASSGERLRPYGHATFPTGTVFSVGTPPTIVTGDEIRVFPENPTSTPANLSRLQARFQVDRSMAPDTVRVSDAALRHFGKMFRGTGDGVLKVDTTSAASGELDIKIPNTSDLGGMVATIGPDNLGPAPGATASEDCLIWEVTDGTAGSEDHFSVIGTLPAAPTVETEIVSLSLTSTGPIWNVTPDFSPIGSSSPDLQLKNGDGVPIYSVPAFSGSYAVAGTGMPVELGAARNGTLTIVHAYDSDRSITIPGHGTFLASRVELSAPAGPAVVTSYTGLARSTKLVGGGTLGVKVEKSQFKGAELSGLLPVAAVRTTGLSYTTPGYDHVVFHTAPDTTEPGLPGVIVFADDNLNNNFGVKWLPLGPVPAAGQAEIEAFWVVNASDSDGDGVAPQGSGPSVKLVSNGTVADMFVDPGSSGVTEVKVIVRDKDGRVQLQFPWLNFSQPALTIPDFPIAAGSHRLSATGERGIWFDLGYEAVLPIGGPMGAANVGSAGITRRAGGAAMTKAELIEVLYEPADSSGGTLDPGFGIRAPGFTEMVFVSEEPRAVNVRYTPQRQTTMNLPYPNPFNPTTTLSFELRDAGPVSLRIYNVEGRYVTTVHAGALGAGPHAFKWDGRNRHGHTVASGVYLVELRAPDGVRHAKVNLLK